jgi:hypothetical protein
MTTYNTGYPQSNAVAVPPVMNKQSELGGRVRVAYGKVTIPASSVPGTTDVVNITKVPAGCRLLGLMAKWQDLNDSTHTFTVRAGTTAISAALDVGTAQTAYAWDYTGVGVEPAAGSETINVVLGGAAMNGTAANKFEMILFYVSL